MLIPRKQSPLDYSLCNQTVTVYRRESLQRQVLEGVYYDGRREETVRDEQLDAGVHFTLIIPGQVALAPGDKVLPGVGPVLETAEQWAALTADSLPYLGIVASVSTKYWQGQPCHVEVKG